MSVLDELKRRNVIRMAGLYLVGAWLLVQVSSTLLPMFEAPAWMARAIVMTLAIGFLPVLAFSWAFELTPDGLRKDAGPGTDNPMAPRVSERMQRLTLALAVLAVAYLLVDKFVLTPERHATTIAATTAKPPAVQRASIAVLPFVNMSSDREQEYFSDGISEELLNQLAQIPQLRVIARTSSFAFKGKEVGVDEIARQLKVDHVLEGSVRKNGDKLRITAQLIRSSDSSHLWSGTFDRNAADVFAVQDEISAAVVRELKLKLLGETPKSRKTDPRAFALFLQGRNAWRQNSPESMAQAIKLLRQAVEIDPGYADAWSGLSLSYLIQSGKSHEFLLKNEAPTLDAANRALAADPDNAPAHARIANVAQSWHNDLATSAKHLERAVALGPNNTDVIDEAGNLNLSLGRIEQATAFHAYAARLDPMSAYAHFHLGQDYLSAGRVDEAIDSARVATSLSPNSDEFRMGLALALFERGDWPALLAELPSWPEGPTRRLASTQALHALGREAESKAALAELIKRDGAELPYWVAVAMAKRGDADGAFAWLDRLISLTKFMSSGAHKDPGLAQLRTDPRWLPLLRKHGEAPEQLAAIKFDVAVPAAP